VQVVIWNYLQRIVRRDRGQRGASLVEYALLVALIAIVCVVAIAFLGTNASNKFSQVGSAIQ